MMMMMTMLSILLLSLSSSSFYYYYCYPRGHCLAAPVAAADVAAVVDTFYSVFDFFVDVVPQ